MALTSNQQFVLLAIIIIGVLGLIAKSMIYAERKAEREYFKDLADKGYDISKLLEEDEEDA